MPPLEVLPAFRALGIALALGLLVGIQRERSEARVAGVRTFALATLLGCCLAILGSAIGTSPEVGFVDAAAPSAHASDTNDTEARGESARDTPRESAGGASDAAPDGSGARASETASNARAQNAVRNENGPAREPQAEEPDSVLPSDGPRAAHLSNASPLASLGAGLILLAGAAGVITFAVLGNYIQLRKGELHSGMSTEIALLTMYAVGAMAWLAPIAVTAGIGVGIAVLLHAKEALHAFSRRLGEKDVRAVLTFALITFIILPVVPDRTYGPFDVLNPHEAWRMVVLVVGMSLAGYIASKLFGGKGGTVVAGLLGGLVSSTATTAAAARQSRHPGGDGNVGPADAETSSSAGSADPAPANGADGQTSGAARAHAIDNLAATMVLLATVVMYARVLTEVAVVAPSHAMAIAPPIAIVGAATLLLAMVMWLRASRSPAEAPEPGNPAALRPAIVFGLLYAGVLFVAAAGERYLGAGGLYVVAGISGLTDMDAITLSSARLVQDGRLAQSDAARTILIAATANMVFKTGMIATIGSRGLLRRVGGAYAICSVGAIALVLLWPGE